MRWEDERYVRLYTRDTIDWLALSFEAQGLLALLLRKVDRAGILRLGRHGARGVAAAIGHAPRWDAIRPALDELLADGCVVIEGEALVVRNFVEAQEANQSEAARKRAQRERDRDKALAEGVPARHSDQAIEVIARMQRAESVTKRDEASRHVVTPEVTKRDRVRDIGHADTDTGHAGMVTPSLPSRAVPSEEKTAGADAPRPPPRPRKAPEKPTDPRHAPLVQALVAACPGYAFTGRDAKAVSSLLALGEPDEVTRRWRLALAAEGFPRVRTLSELSTHWNHFAGAGPPTRAGGARVVDLRKAPVRAEDVNQEALAQVGDVTQELFRGRQS